VLTLGALVAIFRFGIGMIPVLAACAALGVGYHLVGGAI
jgi:chromate transporter